MTDEAKEAAPPAIPDNLSIATLTAMYVKMRDNIKARDEAYKTSMKPAKAMLEQLGNRLLDELNKSGGESIKSKNGTVYKTERTSASIQDGPAFRDFVIANELYDLLDWKANAPAVKDHIAEHGAAPPGINLNTAIVIGVRRPDEK